MNSAKFQSLIKKILTEEVEKDSAKKASLRLPEVTHDEDYKKITPHNRDIKSKDELLDEMDKIVKGANKDYMVVWDDHDDMSITGHDLFNIRVTPKWENNYCIEAFVRHEDRVYVTGQSWEQVKEFVKVNLKNTSPNTDKAYKKSIDNSTMDNSAKADKDLSQKDKPKILPLTNEPVKTTKNKDKNYTEVPKDDDNLPEKPMKEVGEFKKQSEYKVKDPVKLRKKKSSDKLVVKMD